MPPTCYQLPTNNNFKWSETQQQSISRDLPLPPFTEDMPDDQFVQNTYLAFLWLPSSVMPLNRLVPSLRRVGTPRDSAHPHPLHDLLDPVLLTTRSAATKYHTELPQIIADGGGIGEREEQIMWYAYNNELGEENDDSQMSWTRTWFEKMERREAQIQILLYMLKMSLPGPVPSNTPEPQEPVLRSTPRKQKRPHADVLSFLSPKKSIPTESDKLESFMDKLSMWQLVGALEDVPGKPKPKGVRDWMQVFCEDVVETCFNIDLPSECELLRSKVFPTSPFSDDEEEDDLDQPPSRPASRSSSPNLSMLPSRQQSLSRSSSLMNDKPSNSRSRSRSLSVSLAEEREQQESTTYVRKRPFVREVSMSLSAPKRRRVDSTSSMAPPQVKSATSQPAASTSQVKLGETLVEETPAKTKAKSQGPTRTQSFRGLAKIPSGNLFAASTSQAVADGQDGESLRTRSSSPATLFDDWDDSDDEVMEVPQTPTKKRR